MTILDRDDRAFPLALGPTLPIVRTLYRRSKRLAWSPVDAIPWDAFDGSRYGPEVKEAGRIYYSGRAWGEYGAISESPAMQLRYDLDELAPDLSLFWALRTQEEARHAEVSARMADLLGGYLPEPPPAPPTAAAPPAAAPRRPPPTRRRPRATRSRPTRSRRRGPTSAPGPGRWPPTCPSRPPSPDWCAWRRPSSTTCSSRSSAS